jgi:uncharacterized protein (TIGR00661 family)
MRILYGVAGGGLGHATRSRVVLEELAREHDLQIASAADVFGYLSERAPEGSHVSELGAGGDDQAWRGLEQIAEAFRPDAVITDLEPLTTRYALLHSVPLVSIDHIHAIDRCRHDPGLVHGHESELWSNKQRVGDSVPDATHYVITTFFYPLLVEPRTTLVPPILRPEVLAASSERGEHLLVYRSDSGPDDLSRTLAESGLRCRIYGLRPGVEAGNLEYRPFSEAGFVDDLRTARAVVASGSFTLLGEALYLGKPVLTHPSPGHFGHVLNALYVDRLGYGKYAPEVTPATIDDFLDEEHTVRERLAGYRQDANEVALQTVRRVLAEVSARPKNRHRAVHMMRS